MPQFIDRTGQRFGRLTVLNKHETRHIGKKKTPVVYWHCKCDCGETRITSASSLKSGDTRSCGCLLKARKPSQTKHGKTGTREYVAWQNMKRRCYDKGYKNYRCWGGRGITVCSQWLDSFEQFLKDMGPAPANASLDRINNDGNYEPGNCCWTTRHQQQRNTVRNHKLRHKGKTLTLVEWSQLTGIGATTIRARLKRGWAVSEALSTPVLRRK